MGHWLKGAMFAGAGAAVVAALWLGTASTAGQAEAYKAPRTADGKPDLNGVWQAVNTANYDIQAHAARPALALRPAPARSGAPGLGRATPADLPAIPVIALGAAGGVPAGHGVVEGNEIPYQPWAAAKAKLIHDNHVDPTPQFLDPDARCFLQGVPRHLYNRELEIWQAPGHVVIFNMAHHTFRVIPLNSGPHIPERVKLWMGDSRSRWERNTLVVDVANSNDQTWFDIVGDFHSDALHVAERFTRVSADAIEYEAVITDPNVYTRPWKMALRLVRQKAQNVEMWEEACYENNERSLEGMLNRPGR